MRIEVQSFDHMHMQQAIAKQTSSRCDVDEGGSRCYDYSDSYTILKYLQNGKFWVEVPTCDICDTLFGDGSLCPSCWEVTRRLPEFVKWPKGEQWLRRVLREIDMGRAREVLDSLEGTNIGSGPYE